MGCLIANIECRRLDDGIDVISHREDSAPSIKAQRGDVAPVVSSECSSVDVSLLSWRMDTQIEVSAAMLCDIGQARRRLLRAKGGDIILTSSGNYIYLKN